MMQLRGFMTSWHKLAVSFSENSACMIMRSLSMMYEMSLISKNCLTCPAMVTVFMSIAMIFVDRFLCGD